MDDDLEPLPADETARLRGLLNTSPVPAGPEALRAIVARRDRWRLRALGAALAIALVAGPVTGYAVGHSGRGSGTSVAASSADRRGAAANAASPNTPSPAIAGGSGGSASSGSAAIAAPFPEPATQLFLRDTSDGIRIRAYETSFPKILPAPAGPTTGGGSGASAGPATAAPTCAPNTVCPTPVVPVAPVPTCLPTSFIQAEVSNDQVAGADGTTDFSDDSAPLSILSANVVGQGQPTPIGTVIVHTSPAVATVRLVLDGGGTDQMAPVKGLAVLAHGVAGLALSTPSPVIEGVPGKTASSPAFVPPVPPKVLLGFGFPKATVTALDAAGSVLATVTLPSSVDFGPKTSCLVPGPIPNGGPASGGAVSSSGGVSSSSGTGTATPGASGQPAPAKPQN